MGPQEVNALIQSRRSVRAFTQQPVERSIIETILETAARAPSGTNTQPWKVYVVQGETRARVVDAVCAAHEALRQDPSLSSVYQEAYDYYPRNWVSPYIDRRRENGWSLYGLLGIGKADRDKMHVQHQRNYRFFDAPVGLFFTVDRVMGRGALIDTGGMMQNVMISARAYGLHTCSQAAWITFSSVVLPLIGAPETEMLVCGMALGYEDEAAVENRLRTPRVPLSAFTQWRE